MKQGMHLSRVWFDEHLVELQVRVSEGSSSFGNKVYVGHAEFKDAVSALQVFQNDLFGPAFDLRFGEFGPEGANGAFCARFWCAAPGRLFVSCEQESEFEEFGTKVVASRCTMYLKSEPALLDRFIAELRALGTGAKDEAYLEAV